MTSTRMNTEQEKALADLNDRYGVKEWRMAGDRVYVEFDDTDEAVIQRDGTWSLIESVEDMRDAFPPEDAV